jgi:dienelactone hydrolase
MLVVSDVDTDDGRSHPPRTRRHRWWLWVGAAVLVLLAVAAGGFYLWATTTSDPGPRAVAALDSDEQVQVIEDDGYTFQPTRPTPVGFIFYPGGRVDPASYAAPAREIAEDAIADHPEIERWVIGGHSLGGTIAASYAGEHRDTISGLVLWAAYPSNGTDLSTVDAVVASVFGTRDGLTTLDDIDDSRNRLPAATNFVSIEGGNHAQFGDYGTQDGDNPATISREEQQAQAVQATLRVLNAAK